MRHAQDEDLCLVPRLRVLHRHPGHLVAQVGWDLHRLQLLRLALLCLHLLPFQGGRACGQGAACGPSATLAAALAPLSVRSERCWRLAQVALRPEGQSRARMPLRLVALRRQLGTHACTAAAPQEELSACVHPAQLSLGKTGSARLIRFSRCPGVLWET